MNNHMKAIKNGLIEIIDVTKGIEIEMSGHSYVLVLTKDNGVNVWIDNSGCHNLEEMSLSTVFALLDEGLDRAEVARQSKASEWSSDPAEAIREAYKGKISLQ